MRTSVIFYAALWLTGSCLASTAPNCPPLGPVFPKLTDYSKSAAILAAVANLTAIFTARDADNSTGAWSTSYGIEVFQASTGTPIFEWYHTAPNLTGAEYGVHTVDRNTVYRLGSLTKVFTVFTWLVQDGDAKFNDPITKYVPELSAAADLAKNDPVNHVAWDDVTIGALASQLGGIIRDYGLLGETTQEMNQTQLLPLGFPPLNSTDPMLPECGEWPLCNRTEFFNGLLRAPPSYAPFTTAAYANTAYQIMAYALESIKGQSFQSMLQDSVLTPLALNRTYYTQAPEDVGIIPEPSGKSEYFYSLGDESPAGNMYSSVGDLSDFGRAILKSTLIKPALTRRWLKPASLTSDPKAGVGYPWGVRRIILPLENGHRVSDAYNKAGRVGFYSALLNLLPDWDVGFTILVGGSQIPGNFNFFIADILGESIVPALDAAGREAANAKYGGFYYNVEANSTLTLTVEDDRPGLGISQWMSNGTDEQYIATALMATYSPVIPAVRLYPTGLETVNADGSRQVAFKATFEDLQAQARPTTMFSTDCGSWVGLTSVTYGTLPIDQFVFNVDSSGKVTGVSPRAYRVTLQKA